MSKFISLLVLLAMLSLAACLPGGAPSSPAAPSVPVAPAAAAPSEKQQIITFMKALLPQEMESRAIDKEFDAYLDARDKLTKAQRDAKEAEFQKRATAIITNASLISRPNIPELRTFFDAWLAYQINYDAMLAAGIKGDVASMGVIIDKFPSLDKAWRAAVNQMLIKYSLGASEVGWPKD